MIGRLIASSGREGGSSVAVTLEVLLSWDFRSSVASLLRRFVGRCGEASEPEIVRRQGATSSTRHTWSSGERGSVVRGRKEAKAQTTTPLRSSCMPGSLPKFQQNVQTRRAVCFCGGGGVVGRADEIQGRRSAGEPKMRSVVRR